MARSPQTPTPKFFVDDDVKEDMAGQLVAQTIFGIERRQSPPGSLLADDFIDLVARPLAALLAADINLKTPRDLRLGADTVAAYILKHAVRYRAEEAETGVTAFNRMLAENPIPDEMRKAWNDS